jgi:hypothetical protein
MEFVLYSFIYKSNSVCLYVWAVRGRFFQSLPVPCGAGDKQGRAGQPLQGVAQGKPWGKPGDLHLIKQKYDLKKNHFHYKNI